LGRLAGPFQGIARAGKLDDVRLQNLGIKMKRGISFIATLGLTCTIAIYLPKSADAVPACGRPTGIGYECYEDGVVNARVGFGETKHFSGQIQAGSGYVITRVEFINQAQFGSVSGPNIKKIQSRSSVKISEILSETSRQLEEAYNKARAEYKNVKYMAEAHDRTLKEIASRKEALSNVESNVEVVNWDGSVSGRCVRSVFGRCVDSIGGKLEGKVRVYKLYIGSPDEYASYAQSVKQRLDQALALTIEENKPVEPVVEEKTCFSVDSRKGWQTVKANNIVAAINYIEGGWSVDTRSYSMVSYQGHQGADAERLAPFNAYKYNQSFPFGALLMELPSGEVIWANQLAAPLSSSIFPAGSTFRFRINDADEALGDNGGSLKGCLVEGVG
jgi:hypothetical protein